jgi:hypothetical protein
VGHFRSAATRGINENTNGLLRRTLPKDTDQSVHSHPHAALSKSLLRGGWWYDVNQSYTPSSAMLLAGDSPWRIAARAVMVPMFHFWPRSLFKLPCMA